MGQILSDVEPAREKIASLFDPAKRMQLEMTQFTTLYQSTFADTLGSGY